MTIRVAIFILCFFTINVFAQQANSIKNGQDPTARIEQSKDELLKHLNAAESYQLSGDLYNAGIENRAVLGIALERLGNIAIEEGKYTDAVKIISESLTFADTPPNRTLLAIAYLRQNLFEKALTQAQMAVTMDPKHIGGHYILGNINYTKEDYQGALPSLEKVFATAPDFEIARALGLTYLNLKKPELARTHFEKMVKSAGQPNADLHILFAKFYEATNYPDDAERELKRALSIEPNKPKINFYLGFLLLQNGGSSRLAESGTAFENELKFNPNDFYSLFFSGVVASSQNEHKEAVSFLKRATKINPNSGEAFLFLGQSQIELGDIENAEKNLRRAVALEANGGKNTQARRTHFMLGRLLLRSGRKEEGKKELAIAGKLQQKSLNSSRDEINQILNQVAESGQTNEFKKDAVGFNVDIDLSPEREKQLINVKAFLINTVTQSYNNLGVIAAQNKSFSVAIENFSSAFEWNSDFPNLARNLGIISFRANEFETAIAPLSKQLEANPQDTLVRKMLGSSYYFTKDFEKSVETLKPIESSIKENAELAYFYGISLIQLKRNKEAVPVFDAIARVSQDTPEALFYAGQGFMIAGEYKRAITEFERILSLVPTTTKANYFIGQSFIRLNRTAEAEKAFARELVISPNDALSKYHLALTLIERKIETERAIKTLEEAINLRYDYADARYQLGKIYLEKGNVAKAIEQLEIAASSSKNKDYIHYQLSIAYRKASRKDDAARELKIYQKLKKEKRSTDNSLPMGADEIPIP